MRALLQALAVKQGKSISDLKPTLPAELDTEQAAPDTSGALPNPFRDKKLQ